MFRGAYHVPLLHNMSHVTTYSFKHAGVGGESWVAKIGCHAPGFYVNRVCAHVLHGEHGRHGPIAIAGGGQ